MTMVIPESPVRTYRKMFNLTTKELSLQLNCNIQTVTELESGMFFKPLESFLELVERQFDRDSFLNAYFTFQNISRVAAVQSFPLSEDFLGSGAPSVNPYASLLKSWGIGSKTFAKSYCLPSGVLYRISRGLGKTLPKNLTYALSGLPNGSDFCSEWNERHFIHHGYLKKLGKV